MKKLFFLLIAIGAFTTSSLAQEYHWGIGIRGGLASGITAKFFYEGDKAWEGILTTRHDGLMVTGLHEWQNSISPGFSWFYGVGGHLGTWPGNDDFDGDLVIGVDGIVGLEYEFYSEFNVPVSLSLDYKPAFNIIESSGFNGDELALSIRFIFP
jgi:hypothetical protein